MAEHVSERVEPTSADGPTYVGLEHLDSGSLTVRRWGADVDLIGTKLRMRKGEILFARRNAYLRRVALAPHDGVFSAHGMVLRARPDVALPEFLPFFMQSDVFMDRAEQISVGSLSPTINWTTLREQEFDLPPLAEQRRIAASMARFQAVLDASSELRTTVLRLEGAVLEDAFDRGAAQQVQLERHNVDAEWLELGNLAPLQAGYAFPSSEFSSSGDRLLRGSNVGVDRTNWDPSDTRYWQSSRREEVQAFILNDDDIVIAMDRPFISEGFKVARLSSADLPALLLQRVGRFLASDEPTRALVWAFVHSRSFQLQLLAQQEGTDLPHISKSQIEGTLLPRKTVHEGRVGDAFGALFRVRANVETRQSSLRSLRSTFMREALT